MQVVNKKTHPTGPNDVYIGRPSVLGNPFVIGRHGDRAQVIAQYRRWLWGKLEAKDPQVLAALRALKPEANLVCWCAPEPCHGDIVVRAAEWLRKEGRHA